MNWLIDRTDSRPVPMITIPVYQIICDEVGCGRVDTFPLASTKFHHVYELRAPDEVYAHFGGETIDGRHRCASCRAKLNPSNSEPQEVCARLDHVRSIDLLAPVRAIIQQARAYRRMEQDGTPRLWRGKDLQKKATDLDEAIEKFDLAQNV